MSSSFDPKTVKLTKKTTAPRNAPVQEEEPKKVGSATGRKIIQARNAAQMKQKDLAMKTNLPLHIISEWESGGAAFDKKVANKIRKALGIEL